MERENEGAEPELERQEESSEEEVMSEEDVDPDSPVNVRRSNRQRVAARKFTFDSIGGNPVMTAVNGNGAGVGVG